MKKAKKTSPHRRARVQKNLNPVAARTRFRKPTSRSVKISRRSAETRKPVIVPAAPPGGAAARRWWADLPFSYNETKLVLMVRDTTWAYGYWDFSSETWNWMQNFFAKDRHAKPKLRLHNIDQHFFQDLDVDLNAKNWYLDLGSPDTAFEAELGILDSAGRFHRIAKSNRIRTPRSGPSEKIDSEWVPEDFEEIYRLSGGGKKGHGSEIFSMFKRLHHRLPSRVPLKNFPA